MEDQVTYPSHPLASNLQGIPKIKNIRGSSMLGWVLCMLFLKKM